VLISSFKDGGLFAGMLLLVVLLLCFDLLVVLVC